MMGVTEVWEWWVKRVGEASQKQMPPLQMLGI